MRRPLSLVVLVVAALLVAAGIAAAAFTAHHETPQTFTASDSFGPPGQVALTARSRTNDAGAAAADIGLGLQLSNTGTAAIELAGLSMRYWLTSDARGGGPSAACLTATLGCANVGLRMVQLANAQENADHYLEVAFLNGQLAPGESATLDQLEIRQKSPGTFDQHDDHSFKDQDAFADNAQVTVYDHGRLVSGAEPDHLPIDEEAQVLYANLDDDPHDPLISTRLVVENTGAASINMKNLTVRYWFTSDNDSAPLAFCDFAEYKCTKLGLSLIRVHPRPGADHYLEVSFKSGTLAAGATTGPIELHLQHADYSPFDETDDHSHGSNTSLEPAPKITADLNGVPIWGTEP